MHLMLKWKSNRDITYKLGILYKENGKYIFDIEIEELKKAILDGCMGIGNFSLLNKKEESDVLFDFFKHRIVSKDSWRVKEVLERYNLKEYDEMKILAATNAKSMNDRYWVEEI